MEQVMHFQAINPYSERIAAQHPAWTAADIERALRGAAEAAPAWAARPMAERCVLLRRAGEVLRERADEFASLITQEMGKLLREARAEVEKCALTCEYYAEHGAAYLADEPVATDARRSLITYQPLGTVLAIMPWNFPFWQVVRFAAPALVAGNTALLKHASNVPGCALALEQVFRQAGLPEGAFTTMLIDPAQAEAVIADPRVHAVTLTGSEAAGRQVAATAGAHLKKAVLELGGSDPFVVLEDCDLERAVATAVQARFMNAGQSCIAAKRFIVVEAIADPFVARFKEQVQALRPGDPMHADTDLAPLARADLLHDLEAQVQDSLRCGAEAVTGCHRLERPGFFYAPSILDRVVEGMRAYHEEVFGPVAAVIRVRDETEAVRVANASDFGLGGSIWTRDAARGERLARLLACGSAFVNGLVKSDPRLPFGGIKHSGFGRELSEPGIREFVNVKTLWLG